MSELVPTFRGNLVDPLEAAWGDDERRQRAERRKALFFEFLHKLADEYGVDLDVKRSKCRWSDQSDPPGLVAATVRFTRPGTTKTKRVSL